MSYNLPDDCSDFDVDVAAGGYDPPEWTCPNKDCGEQWRETPELWVCECEQCDIATCPTCESACFGCARHLCADHYTLADWGDGVKRYCQDCLEDFAEDEEQLPEALGPASEAASRDKTRTCA